MGTHPIFESDFDCLTDQKNESHPVPSHDPVCSTPWWFAKAYRAQVLGQLAAPVAWLGIDAPVERRVCLARLVELLARRCPQERSHWPGHRPVQILHLGRRLLLRALPLARPQCLQAIRLAIR